MAQCSSWIFFKICISNLSSIFICQIFLQYFFLKMNSDNLFNKLYAPNSFVVIDLGSKSFILIEVNYYVLGLIIRPYSLGLTSVFSLLILCFYNSCNTSSNLPAHGIAPSFIRAVCKFSNSILSCRVQLYYNCKQLFIWHV